MARIGLPGLKARLTGRGVDLRAQLVDGGGTGTNLGCPGIKRGDVLLAVLPFDPAGPGWMIGTGDLSSAATVFANDIIRVDFNTTGKQLVVHWATR